MLFFPVLIFLFLGGLIVYSLDSLKRGNKKERKDAKDNVTLIPAIFEEQQVPTE